MDQVKSLIGLILIAVTAVSCNSGKFSEEIETVDSLITVVEGYQVSLDSANADTVNAKLVVVSDRMDYLADNYKDSTDRKFWITNMNYLRQVRKAYSSYGDQKEPLSREIDQSLRQLNTLRNSLEDEKLSEEEAQMYVEDEAEVVARIGFNTQRMNNSLRWGDEVWDTLRPYFDSITMYQRSQPVQ